MDQFFSGTPPKTRGVPITLPLLLHRDLLSVGMKLQDVDDLCSLRYIANDMKAWKELSTNIVSKAVDLEIQNLTEARTIEHG